jgi:hypothetical protein
MTFAIELRLLRHAFGVGGVAFGAAHADTTSITNIRVIPRVKNLLWFILFTSFRFLNQLNFGFAPDQALAFCAITIASYHLTLLPFFAKFRQKFEFMPCYS